MFFSGFVVVAGGTAGKIACVKGNVGDDVKFNSHNASFQIEGAVGSRCMFKTHNGDVNARNMAENFQASSHNGSVHVVHADSTATLETHNGDVYENGVKRKKPSRAEGVSVSIEGKIIITYNSTQVAGESFEFPAKTNRQLTLR